MKYLILSLLCIISACSMDGEPGSNSLTGIVIIGDNPTAAIKTAIHSFEATVVLIDSENPKQVIQETTTDSDGRYLFTNIPDGQYYLVTREDWNYGHIEENISFNNGTNKTLDVTMAAFKKHSYDFQVDEDELYFYNVALENYSESHEFYYLEESKNIYTGTKANKSQKYAVEIKDNSLLISNANTIIYKTDQLSTTPNAGRNPQPLPIATKDYSYLPQSYTANSLDVTTQQYTIVLTAPTNKQVSFYGHLYLKDHLETPIAQHTPNDIGMISFNNLSDGNYVFIAQAGHDYGAHIVFSIPNNSSLEFFNFTLTTKVTVQFAHSLQGEFGSVDWFSFSTSKELLETNTLLYLPGITNIYSIYGHGETKKPEQQISITDSANIIVVRDFPSGDIIDSIIKIQELDPITIPTIHVEEDINFDSTQYSTIITDPNNNYTDYTAHLYHKNDLSTPIMN